MKPHYFFSLIIFCVLLDAITKISAEKYLLSEIILIPHFLSLEYIRNPWIAFSIPVTGIFLKIITIVLIFWIIYYYRKEEKRKKNIYIDISFWLILAGAIGNAWERILRNSVTDFISLQNFAIFNIADSCITLWAILFAFTIFQEQHKKKT